MANNNFQFELYRLNIEDENKLYPNFGERIRTDKQIVDVLKHATTSDFDTKKQTSSMLYKWSLRQFTDYGDLPNRGRVVSVVLARSILKKEGLIVTDNGIVSGTSDSHPPLANMITIFFDLHRHLVAAEYLSDIMQSKAWKSALTSILLNAAYKLKLMSRLEFEEIPEHHEIIELFKSFEYITRLKVNLRIPNPELSKYTKELYKDLEDSGIREYTQDMKNPNGLSKAVDSRPFASAALAQDGYKKGEVLFEGYKNGKFSKIKSSEDAARGKTDVLKDFIRGISSNSKTKEAKAIIEAITEEIDRLHPLEEK